MIKNKILTILTVLATVFALIIPVVHADDTTTITIEGDIGGKKMEVYRLFNYDAENDNYTFEPDLTSTQNFFFGYTFEGETQPFTKIYEITEWLKKNSNNEDKLMKVAEAYYTYAKANNISPVATIDLTNDKTKKTHTEDVAKKGYYLIYDVTEQANLGNTTKSAPMLSVVPLTGDNQTIKIKSDTITTPDKTVDTTSQRVGGEVTFTVTATVPKMVEYTTYDFKFIDEMSKGLDYVAGSSTIKISKEGKDTVTLVEGTNYTLTENNRKITVNMIDFINWRDQGYSDGTITWTYKAKLNADAILPGSTINSIKTEYSNDPNSTGTGTTEPNKVEVKVYNLEFTKVDSDKNKLEGAVFTLTKKGESSTIKFDANGVVSATGTDRITSDANGLFSFKGLEAGTYYLEEVGLSDELKAKYRMAGFVMEIEITEENGANPAAIIYKNAKLSEQGYVTATEPGTSTTSVTLNGETFTSTTRYTLKADVLNTLKDELPSTGGIGTVIFTALGVAVMVGAAALFVINKKRNA